MSRDDAWYREAPGRRDAEARGLVEGLRRAVVAVAGRARASDASRLEARARALGRQVAEAEERAVAAALEATLAAAPSAWSPAAWRGAEDASTRRLHALYVEGLARVRAREATAREYAAWVGDRAATVRGVEGAATDADRMRAVAEGLHREGLRAAINDEADARLEATYARARSLNVRGRWAVSGPAGDRVVVLRPDGVLEIDTDRGERGSWSVDRAAGLETEISLRLYLTPGPSQRSQEHVFAGIVRGREFALADDADDADDAAAAPPRAPWSMRKLHDDAGA